MKKFGWIGENLTRNKKHLSGLHIKNINFNFYSIVVSRLNQLNYYGSAIEKCPWGAVMATMFNLGEKIKMMKSSYSIDEARLTLSARP